MRMRQPAKLSGAVAIIFLAAALSGCTAPPLPDEVITSTPTPTPTEATSPWQQQYVSTGDQPVRWGDDGFPHIILMSYGSGSCPNTPATLELLDPTTIAVTFEPPTKGACTDDLKPTSFAAEPPEGLDTFAEITVLVDGEIYGTLPPLQS